MAEDLALPFLELNAAISQESELAPAEIFSLYGAEGYRRFEQNCLKRIVERYDACVLAVGGGIVADPQTYETLLERFRTVWVQTSPEEHMARVRGPGRQPPDGRQPRSDE